MSEKRFEFYSDDYLIGVLDTVTGRTFNSFEILDCLNEQQSTIEQLQEENEQLREINKELEQKAEVLNRIWRSYLDDEQKAE